MLNRRLLTLLGSGVLTDIVAIDKLQIEDATPGSDSLVLRHRSY
jgi:hypothetical protein